MVKLLVEVGSGESVNLEAVAADLGSMKDASYVVVHDVHPLRDSLARRLGVEKHVVTSVSGDESVLSDDDAIDLLLMTCAGLRNKRFVEALQGKGVNAVGLTGLDGAVVRGRRSEGVRVQQGDKTLVRRDLTGKPVVANRKLLGLLLDNGYTPVVTVPIVDEHGSAIHSETDEIVALLDGALKPNLVIQFVEAAGYLADPSAPASVVPRMTWAQVAEREAEATGRTKRKLRALRRLGERPGARVVIADGRVENPVLAALAGRGTQIA